MNNNSSESRAFWKLPVRLGSIRFTGLYVGNVQGYLRVKHVGNVLYLEVRCEFHFKFHFDCNWKKKSKIDLSKFYTFHPLAVITIKKISKFKFMHTLWLLFSTLSIHTYLCIGHVAGLYDNRWSLTIKPERSMFSTEFIFVESIILKE